MLIEFLRKAIYAGTSTEINQKLDAKKTRIINLLSIYALLTISGFAMLNLYMGFVELLVVDACMCLVPIVSYYFSLKRQFARSRIVLFAGIPLAFMYFPLFVGEIGTRYYYIMILVIGFYVFDTPKHLVLFVIYMVVIYAVSKLFLVYGSHPAQYKVLESLNAAPSLAASIIIIAIVIVLFKFDTLEYLKKIDRQTGELERKVEELAAKNMLATSLHRELNHRVKNNFQQISSLLKMEAATYGDSLTAEVLKKTRNRIYALSVVYNKLYSDDFNGQVSLNDYMSELISFLAESLDISVDAFTTDIDDSTVNMQDCNNLGMILNELIVNSVKHSGLPSSKLKIQVAVSMVSNTGVYIEVRDNGRGFTGNTRPNNGLGLTLIDLLLSKNDGNISTSNEDGAVARITYPVSHIVKQTAGI